jgi:hypothetical protein
MKSMEPLCREQEEAIARQVSHLAAKPGCIVGAAGRDYATRAMRRLLHDLGVARTQAARPTFVPTGGVCERPEFELKRVRRGDRVAYRIVVAREKDSGAVRQGRRRLQVVATFREANGQSTVAEKVCDFLNREREWRCVTEHLPAGSGIVMARSVDGREGRARYQAFNPCWWVYVGPGGWEEKARRELTITHWRFVRRGENPPHF